MTAQELILQQLEDSGFQLKKVAEGMSEGAFDHRTTPEGMSPREQFAHLCECYVAFQKAAAGQKHEWGTYQPKDSETTSLLGEFAALRAEAIDLVRSDGSEEGVKNAHMYLVAHDYYHVGQLCQARLDFQKDWNPYAIYDF